MYKVAVILNETELQRYGHANFLTKVKSLFVSGYSFTSFTSVNINQLFENQGLVLYSFDSLFISTNACSDIYVNQVLMKNCSLIYRFIDYNKGLYWGYQKKKAGLKTEVLPSLYEFCSQSDQNKEPSEGLVEIKDEYEKDILLTYPQNVSAENINLQCKNNSFRHHVYRSYILPDNEGAYSPILVDNTYNKERVLLARAIPCSKERIVISTIALDWEGHDDLIVNIIRYITEGIPYLAFIGDKDSNNEFSFLISNAILSKIAFSYWHSVSIIPENIKNICQTYIFAPEINEKVIDCFWNKIKNKRKNIKIYSLQEINQGTNLVLKQYSNYSSIDLVKDSIELWLSTRFETKHMWNRGFWVTFDTLMMMKQVGMKYDAYIEDIFYDIRNNHLNDGLSYDGLIGCTIGLYQLLYYFKPKGFQEINTLKWIINKINDVSIYEKQSFLIMCWKIGLIEKFNLDFKQRYYILLNEVYDVIRTNDYISEIDECRRIEICLIKEISPEKFIKVLLEQQHENGKWVNISRTAYVLITLFNSYSKLKKILGIHISEINYSIEKAILYLRANYNEKTGNCKEDVFSTVRFMHAFFLYNQVLSHSTTDFFETIKENKLNNDYTEIMSSSVYKMGDLYNRIREQDEKEQELINEIKKQYEKEQELINEIKELKMDQKKTKAKLSSRFRVIFNLFVFVLIMFVMLIIYIIFNTNEMPNIIQEIGSIANIIVAFFISLFLQNFLDKIIKKNR